MRTTDRIFELVLASMEPVTLKEIQDKLEIQAGIVSGSLASLCRAGRLLREKREKTNGTGPKMRWVYWAKKD
jgi:predicted transcriptional regulator